MSTQNENNRPQSHVALGTIAGTSTRAVFHAEKSVLMKGASVVFSNAIALSAGDNWTVRLTRARGGVEIGTSGAITAAQVAGGVVDIPVIDEFLVEKNDVVMATISKGGNAPDLVGALVSIDYQVRGN